MIQKFVDAFMRNKENIAKCFEAEEPGSYRKIFEVVVSYIGDGGYGDPDINRITAIDHGDYQGTLIFVVAENVYQPSQYWATRVGYGSCSGCDTLLSIQEDPPEKRTEQYVTLALHMVQNMKEI